jgi:anti-anti-sigma factor
MYHNENKWRRGNVMECNFTVNMDNEVLNINLKGMLDAKNAPALSDELKKYLSTTVKKIIFYVNELEYISSAGLRVIIFTKQKIGDVAEVVMVGVQEDVLDVIRMSGLDSMMTITDSYDSSSS